MHRHGRDGPRPLTMVERSRTSLALRVVGVAIPLDNLRAVQPLVLGVDHICEAIFSEEKRVCQR